MDTVSLVDNTLLVNWPRITINGSDPKCWVDAFSERGRVWTSNLSSIILWICFFFLWEVCIKHFLFIPTLLYVMNITYEEVGKNHWLVWWLYPLVFRPELASFSVKSPANSTRTMKHSTVTLHKVELQFARKENNVVDTASLYLINGLSGN